MLNPIRICEQNWWIAYLCEIILNLGKRLKKMMLFKVFFFNVQLLGPFSLAEHNHLCNLIRELYGKC